VKTKLRKTYNYLIRVAIILISYGFIYYELFYKRNLNELLQVFYEQWQTDFFFVVSALVVILIFVNWGLEAKKWQYLIRKIEKISFSDSYKAILTGLSVSAFTPNRVGEYIGRVFILQKAKRWEGVFITIIGSFSQITATLVCGSFGLMFFIPGNLDTKIYFGHDLNWAAYLLVFFSVLFFLVFYYHISMVSVFVDKYLNKKWKKFSDYINVFKKYSNKELTNVLLYSLIRFLIYNIQFYLLLRILGINLPLHHSLFITTVLYYALTIIPTVALTELGVRGSLAIFLFELYFSHNGGFTEKMGLAIFTASSAIWLLNVIIPALIGTFFVNRLKFFRK
jgi:uncharacterized membrane protein YbhN (UPF0104 family)